MSSCSVENQNPNNPSSPLTWSTLWFKNKKALDHVVHSTLRRRSFYRKPPPSPHRPSSPPPPSRPPPPPPPTIQQTLNQQTLNQETQKEDTQIKETQIKDTQNKDTQFKDTQNKDTQIKDAQNKETLKNETLISDLPQIGCQDFTSLLSEETLLGIFSKVQQKKSNSVVSKTWLSLNGRLTSSIKVLDWGFITSGRIFSRFPNLVDIDLLHGSVIGCHNAKRFDLLLSLGCEFGSFCIDNNVLLPNKFSLVPVSEVDLGLQSLCRNYPNLQRLVVANCSEIGLLNVAEGCLTMQELVLHCCDDQVLRGIAAFKNLQILKLVGTVEGLYSSLVTDIGLTILAQGCKRLVKLELRGCEGSYDGIRAIGQCCQMLEELTFCDHRMDDGWLSAVSFCENLKSLRLVSCKRIDQSPGLDEHLGCCRMLERLHLERCQLRDKQSLRAVFLVCQSVREMVVKDCWGLKDGMFLNAGLCRRLKFLSLEGCSRLTTGGLESVVLSLKELENLRVISCKNIKEDEVTPALSTLFYNLKNLKWTPDNQSLLSTSLPTSGIGKRGGKFFKKLQI